MTVSSHLGASQTLELLDRLKGTVRDFAAREEKLNQELRAKIAATRHRRDAAIEELTGQLSENIARTDLGWHEAKQRAESRHENRKANIIEAHRVSKKKALAAIDDKEGRRKHKLQTETLQTKRNRETGLATAETTLVEFQSTLAQENQALAVLEERAQNSFKGYRKFRRLLAKAPALAGPDLLPDEYQLISEVR